MSWSVRVRRKRLMAAIKRQEYAVCRAKSDTYGVSAGSGITALMSAVRWEERTLEVLRARLAKTYKRRTLDKGVGL